MYRSRRLSVVAVASIFLGLSLNAQATNEDITSLLERLGGYLQPLPDDATYSRWIDQTVGAKLGGTVAVITTTSRFPRLEKKTGKVCTERATVTETVTFDIRDMQAVATTTNPNDSSGAWVVSISTKSGLKLIRYEIAQTMPECPPAPSFAVAPVRYGYAQYSLYMLNKEAAEQLKHLIAGAWQ